MSKKIIIGKSYISDDMLAATKVESGMVPPHMIQSVMRAYACSALEAYRCLRAPASERFEFSNGKVKEAWQLIQ
jgi:hypothetical protein